MSKVLILKKILAFSLVALCGLLLGQLLVKSFSKLTLTDFHVYYYVTRAVFLYKTHPYSNFVPIYPYFFPPASLLIFWPLISASFFVSKIVFTFLNTILLMGSIYLISKIFFGKVIFYSWIMFFLSLVFYPLRFTFSDGQFNVVMLFVYTLGLYALFKKKPLAGGIGLGIGVVTKISPALIILYALFRKNFKLVFISGLTVLLLSQLSEHFVGKDINYYYKEFVINKVSSQSAPFSWTDQSFLAMVKSVSYSQKLTINSNTKSIISYSFVALLLLIFMIIDMRFKKGKFNLSIDYFILTTIGVLGTGLTWFHQYTILLLPLFGTGILCFTKLDKKMKGIRFGYLLGLVLVYALWFLNMKSSTLISGYLLFNMLYGGVLLLVGLFILKAHQNWLIEDESKVKSLAMDKYLIPLFLTFLIVGLCPWSLSQNLKQGRDLARIEAINYMSGVLKSSDAVFKIGESDSYTLSNRAGKGYILFGKNEQNKVLGKMSILFLDPVNNSKYKYIFSSSNGVNFELKARLESRKYIENYGDLYSVIW